jgi:organic hydroperoxide reductase OsmC/OhrA
MTSDDAQAAEVVHRFKIEVHQLEGFEFRVRFDDDRFTPLDMDEPPPLGHDKGPNAARILAAAIGNCLAASLLFSMKKRKVDGGPVTADVSVEIIRRERRLRIGKVVVDLRTRLPANDPQLAECLATFEDFCMVTQSVRHGIEVDVHVLDPS